MAFGKRQPEYTLRKLQGQSLLIKEGYIFTKPYQYDVISVEIGKPTEKASPEAIELVRNALQAPGWEITDRSNDYDAKGARELGTPTIPRYSNALVIKGAAFKDIIEKIDLYEKTIYEKQAEEIATQIKDIFANKKNSVFVPQQPIEHAIGEIRLYVSIGGINKANFINAELNRLARDAKVDVEIMQNIRDKISEITGLNISEQKRLRSH